MQRYKKDTYIKSKIAIELFSYAWDNFVGCPFQICLFLFYATKTINCLFIFHFIVGLCFMCNVKKFVYK